MKKILLFGLLSMLSVSSLNAQKKNVIKIRPLTLVIGNYDLTYERAIGSKSSVALNFSFLNWDVKDEIKPYIKGTVNSASISGYMVTPQYRYYFKGEAPKGFYINPFFQYGKYTVAQNNTDQYNFSSGSSASLSILGLGAGLGYQWVMGAFTIDWNFFGIGVQSWDLSFKYDVLTADNNTNANDIVTNLDNSGLFPGFKVAYPSTGGIEINGPKAILPMFKSNLSLGFAF